MPSRLAWGFRTASRMPQAEAEQHAVIASLSYDPRELEVVEGLLAGIPRGFTTVLQAAISQTLVSMKTQVVRRLAADARIKQKSLRQEVTIAHPYGDELSGSIRFAGRRVPIFEMYARQGKKGVTFRAREGNKLIPHAFIATMPPGHEGAARHKGVFLRMARPTGQASSVLGWGFRPRKVYRENRIETVAEFEARLVKFPKKRSHWGTGSARGGWKKHVHVRKERIVELYGPSFWYLWETHPEAREAILADASDRMSKHLESRMMHVLSRWGGYAYKAAREGASVG